MWYCACLTAVPKINVFSDNVETGECLDLVYSKVRFINKQMHADNNKFSQV